MGTKKGGIPWNKGLTHKIDKRILIKSKHPMWKGGRRMSGGYFLIKCPKHPFCRSDGYILEHRLVMEKMICRYLKPLEVVHHKNKNRLDNRPCNLKLYPNRGKHIIAEHSNRGKFGRFVQKANIYNFNFYSTFINELPLLNNNKCQI